MTSCTVANYNDVSVIFFRVISSFDDVAIETYYPSIQKLYQLQDHPGSPIRIRAISLLEHANHNDSAVLNEKTLKNHFAGLCA